MTALFLFMLVQVESEDDMHHDVSQNYNRENTSHIFIVVCEYNLRNCLKMNTPFKYSKLYKIHLNYQNIKPCSCISHTG